MQKWILLSCILMGCWLSFNAHATSLRVGVVTGAPIAFQSADDGTWHGIAIVLWEQIAEMNHWDYQFILATEDTDEAIHQLANHQYDVLIGGITVTYPRIKQVDFSRPFLMNKMVVFEKGVGADRFYTTLLLVVSKIFNVMFLLIAIVFILIAHILWYFERGKLDDLSRGYFKGIIYAMWSMLLLLVGSLLVDKPHDRISRLLVLSVVAGSVIFSSLISAAFTSSLTVSLTHPQTERGYIISDIHNKHFAAVKGHSSATRVESLGGQLSFFPDINAALNAMLTSRRIDGVAGNAIILKHLINHNPALTKLQLLPIVLAYDEFAFAFPKNSIYHTGTDLALTKLQDDNRVQQICERFVDSADQNACIV